MMTLRLPEALGVDVERFAARHGHKPAQLGAWLVDEGVRRRKHPLVDLRETSGGRMAYVYGTRFAVHWVVQQIRGGMSVEKVAQEFELPAAQVLAALAYTEAYPDEIAADMDRAQDNRNWIEEQDAAWRAGHKAKPQSAAKPKRNGKARQ